MERSTEEDDAASFASASPPIRSHLAELKRSGCNLLVVGDVPEVIRARMTARLLGHAHDPRYRVLVLTVPPANLERYLPADADDVPDATWIVSEETVIERTTSMPAAGTDDEPGDCPWEVRTANELDALGATAVATITYVGLENPSLEPSQLRVGLCDLGAVVDEHGPAKARELVDRIGDTVVRDAGMAHYHLPVAPDEPVVDTIGSDVDGLVELRKHGRYPPEHRWQFPDADIRTRWMQID